MSDRYHRGISQNIRLVGVNHETNVLTICGTTNVLYYLTLDEKAFQCTCPDYKFRALGLGGKHPPNPDHVCKHIYFVLITILKLNPRIVMDYKPSMCKELRVDAMEFLKGIVIKPTKLAGEELAIQRPIEEDDYCPICFEDFNAEPDIFTAGMPEIVYCKASCGKSLHRDCMSVWLKHNSTCVYCRAKWV
tara:strand:+ start:29050 stop:29619 length:570 start_codon:yes stop_codon:yes gene_type:complete